MVDFGLVVLEKKVLNSVNIFLAFPYYTCIPLEKGGALHLNKLESPSSKDALNQVQLKLAEWFWRRFVNLVNVFSLFLYYLPIITSASQILFLFLCIITPSLNIKQGVHVFRIPYLRNSTSYPLIFCFHCALI